MRRMLVAGNWKMNTLRESAGALAGALAAAVPAERAAVDVLVCPPFPYLTTVGELLAGSGVDLGAQDAYLESPGAFTGETAIEMLLDVGCRYVILGHSERRHILGETDVLVGQKVAAAISRGAAGQGLDVILCVGERLSEREADQTQAVLDRQLKGGLSAVNEEQMSRVVIAYEPVWAIGTGVTASPEQAESAHAHLRKWLAERYNTAVAEATRILYGGSVKPDNAVSLLEQPNVDGALVGGASLKTELFVPIIEAAEEIAAR